MDNSFILQYTRKTLKQSEFINSIWALLLPYVDLHWNTAWMASLFRQSRDHLYNFELWLPASDLFTPNLLKCFLRFSFFLLLLLYEGVHSRSFISLMLILVTLGHCSRGDCFSYPVHLWLLLFMFLWSHKRSCFFQRW